jgi:hypothetical protein
VLRGETRYSFQRRFMLARIRDGVVLVDNNKYNHQIYLGKQGNPAIADVTLMTQSAPQSIRYRAPEKARDLFDYSA